MIGGMGFMAGAEVEYFAFAPYVTAAAPENLAAFEPAHKNQGLGIRDIKELTVHFFMRKFEVFRQAFGYRMAGMGDPEPFLLSCFPPGKYAGGAHGLAYWRPG